MFSNNFMTVLDRKKLSDGAQGRTSTINKINSLWAFFKYTYHPTYHKRIPDCFLAVKTPLSNNKPPPMGLDTRVYVYVPWQIQEREVPFLYYLHSSKKSISRNSIIASAHQLMRNRANRTQTKFTVL